MKHSQIFTILITLLCTVSSAQTYTLHDCINIALENNIEVKNAGLDVEAAYAVKRQAFSNYFPKVNVTAGGYYAFKPLLTYGIDDVKDAQSRQLLYNLYSEYGRNYGLPDHLSLFENGVMVAASATQPVFAGGRIVNSNRLASIGVSASELQQDIALTKTIEQVEELFWLIHSLNEKTAVLRQAQGFLDTLRHDVSAAVENGLTTKNNELKVKIKQSEIKSSISKVNNSLLLAKQALCQAIGIEYTDEIIFSDTIPAIDNEPHRPDNLQGIVQGRTESQLLDLGVNAEILKKRLIVGEALPQLLVGLAGSYGNPVFDKFRANGLVFASLNIPITDWIGTSHKIKQQELIIAKAENRRTDLVRKMQLETVQSWNNVEEARHQLEIADNIVAEAEENLRSSIVNHQAGLTTVADLLEAQTICIEAKDRRADATIDLVVKTGKYKRLTKGRDNILN
ncbi:MAG: TolC family protein [Bacteroidales bacterium]|nr:TolC family protein [Bacteroidales bacterium]